MWCPGAYAWFVRLLLLLRHMVGCCNILLREACSRSKAGLRRQCCKTVHLGGLLGTHV